MKLIPATTPPSARPWQVCFGQGSAEEILRSDVQQHLRTVRNAIGFRFLRFHGLFHDNLNVVSRRTDGTLAFHWTGVEKVIDALLELGIRPFLELGPMPLALASGQASIFRWKMNSTPPTDYSEWAQLVEQFAIHCITRYGLDEVREWFFEVWNEPNLKGFWTGSREDYWRLYASAARALKNVDDRLRVGGPATAQARWIPEFIDFCSKSNTPVDFVSTHSYLQDEQTLFPDGTSPYKTGQYLIDQFKRVHQEVRASVMPDLEIHWTEWNALSADSLGRISWTGNPCVDSLYSGAFALHHAVHASRYCDSMSWWVISDVFGEDGISSLPYSCAYGLLNTSGIPKPAFHAFRWLSMLQGPQLEMLPVEGKPGLGALAVSIAGTTRLLLWNYSPMNAPSEEWEDFVEFEFGMRSIITRGHLHRGAGGAFEAWEQLGSAPSLTVAQHDLLAQAAQPSYSAEIVDEGSHQLSFRLKPDEILFVEISPLQSAAQHRGVYRESTMHLEENLADLSRE